MFKKLLVSVLLVLFSFVPSFSAEFKCETPLFGDELSSFSNQDDFVKYKEKGGVSYYNFTGKCKLPIHGKANPAQAYGFVDGKLYVGIFSYQIEGDFEAFRAYALKNMKLMFGENFNGKLKAKPDGDWDVYHINLEGLDLKMKSKYNRLTRQVKTALYYQPLREQLNAMKKE